MAAPSHVVPGRLTHNFFVVLLPRVNVLINIILLGTGTRS
jgi:hypothetical protein